MVGRYEVGGFTGESSMAVSGLGCRPSVGSGLAVSVLFGMCNGLGSQVSYLVGPQFQAFNYVSPVFQLWLVDATCETSLRVCQLMGVVRVTYGMP